MFVLIYFLYLALIDCYMHIDFSNSMGGLILWIKLNFRMIYFFWTKRVVFSLETGPRCTETHTKF